jgi:hypothetical protein
MRTVAFIGKSQVLEIIQFDCMTPPCALSSSLSGVDAVQAAMRLS